MLGIATEPDLLGNNAHAQTHIHTHHNHDNNSILSTLFQYFSWLITEYGAINLLAKVFQKRKQTVFHSKRSRTQGQVSI